MTALAEPVTLTAASFADAWRGAIAAAAKDDERPALDRTVFVETYRHGVRFTSTDSFVISSTVTATTEDGYPTLDEKPDVELLAADPDGRATALAGYAAKVAARAEKNGMDPPLVQLSTRTADDDGQPALTPDLAVEELVIDLEGHDVVAIPIIETGFPGYRSILVTDKKPKPPGEYGLSDHVMATVLAIVKAVGSYVHHESADADAGFRFRVLGTNCRCDGVYMGVRV